MKIVVGLGNPGSNYRATRHNIGFRVVDNVARRQGIVLGQRQGNALVGHCTSNETPLLLAKPQTFMNRSGAAVTALLQEHCATAADLVVIYDDLDLPLGRIRIRTDGSAGGHRGVRSIIEHLGGASFCRIRLGIGRPPEGVAVIDYVLSPFGDAEMEELGRVIDRATEALCCLVHRGAQTAMGIYNRAD